MPWTFSHPAAVLPLTRLCPRWLSLPALIVGSTTPDFGYYIRQFPLATQAHTLLGSVQICLPTGLALLAVGALIRRPLWFLLPGVHRQALAAAALRPLSFSPASLLRVAVSVILGAWTHIFWDGFTHNTGWWVQDNPWVRQAAFHISNHPISWFQFFQHGSTLIGAATCITVYGWWVRQCQPATPPELPVEQARQIARAQRVPDGLRLVLIGGLTVVAAIVAIYQATSYPMHSPGLRPVFAFLFRGAVYGTMVLAPLLLLAALVVERTAPHPPSEPLAPSAPGN